MILPSAKDVLHKVQLYRLLAEIIDEGEIASQTYFKGGSCATMLRFLDRFSVDLDFDIKSKADKKLINDALLSIFKKLNLAVKQKSRQTLFYLLKYQSPADSRNSIKLSLIDNTIKSNIYKSYYLEDLDRFVNCQTKETMFANKLVAVTDRYQKYKTIAGRDIYDIHYYFLHGYQYHQPVIQERTGMTTKEYLQYLVDFIKKKITDRVISQDLNFLLPDKKFQLIRKILKKETMMFLNDEIVRISEPF